MRAALAMVGYWARKTVRRGPRERIQGLRTFYDSINNRNRASMNQGPQLTNQQVNDLVDDWLLRMGELFQEWFRRRFPTQRAAHFGIDAAALSEPQWMHGALYRPLVRSVASLLNSQVHSRNLAGSISRPILTEEEDSRNSTVLPRVITEIEHLPPRAHGIGGIFVRSWIFYFLLRMSRGSSQLEYEDAHIFFAQEGIVVAHFLNEQDPEGLFGYGLYFRPHAKALEAAYNGFVDGNFDTERDRVRAVLSTDERPIRNLEEAQRREIGFERRLGVRRGESNFATEEEAERYWNQEQARQVEEAKKAQTPPAPMSDAWRRLWAYANAQPSVIEAAKRKADREAREAEEEAKRQRLRAMARRKARAAAVKTRPTKVSRDATAPVAKRKAKPSKTRTTSAVVKRAARPTKR